MKEISVKLGVVFLIAVIFLSINVGVKKDETIKGTETKEKKEEKEEKAVQVAVTIDNNVNYIDLDDYLLGVVAGEMPAKFETEALKAQVVASRTFVYNRNLSVDNTTNSQVYLTEDKMRENWGDKYDEYHQKIVAAINDTNDEVMKYEGKYITAMFFSSSNGYTENVEDYFDSSALPYLRSVDCQEFIVCTEEGVGYKLKTQNPDKTFYYPDRLPVCPNMKKNTLEKILHVLKTGENEVHVSDALRENSKKPLEKMLELAAK